ncbi:MAG: cytochrome c family protein, partial [Hyphomicrobiales bacterium]|nr:cytochrome c family protein [Hyphomicrobiales bacterium]
MLSATGIAAAMVVLVAGTQPALSQAPSAQTNLRDIVGPNACAECHKEEAEIWKDTHHFSTFTKMPRSKEARKIAGKMKIKRVKSQSLCLNCHFTTQVSGKKKKPIAGISCESCHSPGKKWEKLHSEFSGKTEKTESKAEAAARWNKTEELGMIRPSTLYPLAKNCYGCHVVPQEKLVNMGGHPAGSPFELLSWSQGEVRHNVWYTKGKTNPVAPQARKRMLYIVGLAVELETALRAISVATKSDTYAFKMARRADAARKKVAAIAKAMPDIPELGKLVTLSHSAGLKLNNRAALTAAADKIATETLALTQK